MQTRKFPRTLEQAFGPYTSKDFTDPQDPMPMADLVVLGTCLASAAIVCIFALVGWL
jgi:hypothetical protein